MDITIYIRVIITRTTEETQCMRTCADDKQHNDYIGTNIMQQAGLLLNHCLHKTTQIKRFSSVMSQTLLFANLFILELNISLFILVHSYYRFHFCRRKEPTIQFLVT